MHTVEHLIVGAGVTGLAYANAVRDLDAGASLLVIERDDEPGGYCKTIRQDGFTWDYSGHFFHFKRPEIESWLRERMPSGSVRTVEKRSFIDFERTQIDFPFQKNIHQLPREDFLACLHDLYFKDELSGPSVTPDSFKELVYRRFGRGIAERFLVPYNEKLYATDLNHLDKDAMGRFFPDAQVAEVIRNFIKPDNASYNASFSYPRGGAIEYIRALLHDLNDSDLALSESLISIDLERRVATTDKREIHYTQLVSSAPLPLLLRACGRPVDDTWSWNQVLVFNLGFDKKGPREPHWIYYPDRELRFYRVGFYDNILDDARMSLYVEIGARHGEHLDIDTERERVLADLKKVGVVEDHALVSWHTVTLNPAYVHITRASILATDRARTELASFGVHTAGRYGGWTYCSIEDNIVEARALATTTTGTR